MTQIDRINGLIGSIAVKAPCRVATTVNITLSGEQTIDGVAVVAEDRVLVKNQTITSENGIYDCSATSWRRATDFNGTRDFTKGTLVRAIEGTANANINFEVISSGTTIDVSSIVFNGEIITSDVTYYANIAALQAITSAPSITNATIKGYAEDGDGGDGGFYWDSASTETEVAGIIVKATTITTGRWKRLYSGAINIRWFGATGDGATDDTTAIQAAIDYGVSISTSLFAPSGDYKAESLVPKTGLTIRGESLGNFAPSQSATTRFISLGNGDYIFSQTSGTVYNFSVEGIDFQGAGASVAGGGIYGLDLSRSQYTDLSFNNFADEAIKLDAGTIARFRNVFAQNCLLDRARHVTAGLKIGVIDITANDCIFDTMEITASLSGTGNKSSADLYVCAFNIGGSNHFADSLIGEISDVGIYLTCSNSRFENCRADLNQGHGWRLDGASSNRFIGCSGTRNSQDTNDTYSQWEVESNTGSNKFASCNADGLSADANKAKYGFNDKLNSDAFKNTYDSNCSAVLNVTKQVNMIAFAGSAWSVPTGGPPKTFAAADATPSVEQYGFFKTGGADTYTDFDDGLPGQQIQIFAGHAATLTHGTNIFTNTGATKVLAVNKIYTLRDVNGVWYEVE